VEDVRKTAEKRAEQNKSRPVGVGFETENQRAEKAAVKRSE
jgi:hypothetical protein